MRNVKSQKKIYGIEKKNIIKIPFQDKHSKKRPSFYFAMSFQDVLKRGDEFLNDYPRTNPFWNLASMQPVCS